MKRRRVWTWLLASLGVLVAVLAAIVGNAHRRADVVFEENRKEIARLIAEFRGRPVARPSMYGEGVEGNAWDLYALHLPVLAALPSAEQEEIPEVGGTWDPDRVPDDEVLGVLYLKYGPQIKGLQDALRRQLVDPRYKYEDGPAMKVDLLPASAAAMRFLEGGVSHFHRMGRGMEALELAALGLGVAQDVGRGAAVLGLMEQVRLESSMAIHLMEMLSGHRFGAAELEHLAGRLDRLDASRPSPAAAWDAEEFLKRMDLGLPASDSDRKELGNWGMTPGWRHLYSWEIARAGALSKLPLQFEAGRRVIALPYHERTCQVRRLLVVGDDERNPVALNHLYGSVSPLKKEVEGVLWRTLLRISVALAWHEVEKGVFPVTLDTLVPRYIAGIPLCPYSGKPFGYRDGKVWSVGGDGVDNGGTPDPQQKVDSPGTDVVWTVKRRK